MLEHLCHPLRVADLLRRMTKGPDYDQLPEALWEKVQKQSMLSPEESAAAEATVLPIREYILPHMSGRGATVEGCQGVQLVYLGR